LSKSSGEPTCKAIKSVKSPTTTKAASLFSKNLFSTSPEVIASVAEVLATVVKATRKYANIVKNAPGCLRQVPTFKRVKNKSIGLMSLPHFGNQSRAWSLHGRFQGINIYFDLIIVRIQRALAIYESGGVGSGDIYLEIKLVRKATARA
jgi:hypothetical protein